jgi:hypothetical protein
MTDRIGVVFRSLLFALVRLYQRLLSPLLPPSCRFVPSCSHYALEVLQMWPLLPGLGLIVRRLSRCHPFHAGGLDGVPICRRVPPPLPLKGRWLGLGRANAVCAETEALSTGGRDASDSAPREGCCHG